MRHTIVKICGITRLEDARDAREAGATGWASSSRARARPRVPAAARAILDGLAADRGSGAPTRVLHGKRCPRRTGGRGGDGLALAREALRLATRAGRSGSAPRRRARALARRLPDAGGVRGAGARTGP